MTTAQTEAAQPADLAVVILAAGKGTRMKSELPKVLHPIAGRSLIGHVLATAEAMNPAYTVAVVRHERDRVVEEIERVSPGVIIVDQDEVPGTGRAVEQAVAALPEDFTGSVVVLSGDVPLIDAETLNRLVADHVADTLQMTILSADFANPTGLGRIIRNMNGDVTGIVEEKDASDAEKAITEINGGIYVFARKPLQDALATIGTDNAQGEKYLTDAAGVILRSGGRVDAFTTRDTWLIHGINDRSQLSAAARELYARIAKRHQLAGVTILNPENTYIDVDVDIAADATVLPGSYLQGKTVVAPNATVGPDTTLVDCVVGKGASIRRSEAHEAAFGAGADVGPFSYIRPGTSLGEKGKIGAFVEAKNAQIGDGSKVPHLSYVGDITVGDGANIGAGTIVANYDGVNKHRSVVEDGARVGSKNVLVSPVTVGAGAYTGAGAVVRKDVPAGALALSVSPQRNLEGWVEQNRPDSASAKAAQKENQA